MGRKKKDNHYNCIYMFVFPNGKRYVGKAKNFNKRMWGHKHYQKLPVDKAIHKYGVENIKIEILEEDLDDDIILKVETQYIDKYNTLIKNGKGYNLIRESFGGSIYDFLDEDGIKRWEENNRETQKKRRDPKNWDGDKRIKERTIKNSGVGTGGNPVQQSPNTVAINVETLEITKHEGYVRCRNYLENKHINTKYDKNNIRKICKKNEEDINNIRTIGKNEKRYVIVHEEQFNNDEENIIKIIKERFHKK